MSYITKTDIEEVREMSSLIAENGKFLLNGQPFKIISGAMHYFRVLPEQWETRLKKLKGMGLNTIETYMAWHYHEKEEGEFDFSGMLDAGAYIDLCGKLGFKVIVRPGPYICSECDLGGLPWWLLNKNCALRSNDPEYLKYALRYLSRVAEILRPRLAENGGCIIAVQAENEYGGFTVCPEHLETVKNHLVNEGLNCLLFTSDGAWKSDEFMFESGSVPSLLATGNFRGYEAKDSIDMIKRLRPDFPVMITEFWNGRSVKYNMDYSHRSAKVIASHLDTILNEGASVNLYMAHGGSNFGYMNGAVYEQVDGKNTFLVQSSSYDADAPLNEYGEITDKYLAEREVIYKHLGEKLPKLSVSPVKTVEYGEVKLTSFASVADNLDLLKDKKTFCYKPISMEEAGQGYGTIVYSTRIAKPSLSPISLGIENVRDIATVYVNGKPAGEIVRDGEKETVVKVDASAPDTRVDIVVENLGRCNFGNVIYDKKGIIGNVVYHGNRVLYNFDVYCISYDSIPDSVFKPLDGAVVKDGHTLYKGEFRADEKGETFVSLKGFTRGNIFINGFNLGRYFACGPHKTVYLPSPLIKTGKNEIVVTDCRGGSDKQVFLTAKQELTGKGAMRSPFSDTDFSDNAVKIK